MDACEKKSAIKLINSLGGKTVKKFIGIGGFGGFDLS